MSDCESGTGERTGPEAKKASDVHESTSGCWQIILLVVIFGFFGGYFVLEIFCTALFGEGLSKGVVAFLIGTPCCLLLFDCLFCHKYCCGDDDSHLITCPLCMYKIEKDSWDAGYHRQECFRLNNSILSQFHVLYPDIVCPTCSKPLPVWPADRCQKFECKRCSPPSNNGAVQNNGCNLFRCFRCNYDVCLNCVTKSLSERQQQRVEQVDRQQRQIQQQIQQLQQQALAAQALATAATHQLQTDSPGRRPSAPPEYSPPQAGPEPPPSYEEIQGKQ